MKIVVGALIAGMVLFAIGSAVREIKLYKNHLQGRGEFLVSKHRRNRRLFIAFVLLLEAAFLFCGVFLLNFTTPISALLFWIPPLFLIVFLVSLGLKDLRETSRDIDVIVRETSDVILKKHHQ